MGMIPECIVGFDDEAKALIDRLVGGSSPLEIIPIVGMAGLGKTTLAKKVYSTLSSQHRFHVQLWCTVSQIYNMKKLLFDILCSDGEHPGTIEALDEGALLEKLRKRLLRTKYLVVFDDVWDIKVWNDVRLAFPDDKNGSRIIFTSRLSNVASQLEHGREPHSLRPRTDGESWDLLRKKVFGETECPEGLQEIGREVAQNCKGLPLSVVIMAGILANTPYDGWDEVANRLRTTLYKTDECKNTLELSYIYLPPYLRPCYLYFAVFPQFEKIKSKKLMQLWMAEGFVHCRDGEILENFAEAILIDLIGRNLVMVDKQRSQGGVSTCRIHDLLHEFCKAKAKEENFLQVLHEYDDLSTFDVPTNLTRLSISYGVKQLQELCPHCPQLSSLLYFNPYFSILSFFNQLRDIPLDIPPCFETYRSLRVLDIEQIYLSDKNFPREIVSLVQLRYLAILGEMSIPYFIAELSNLETFHLTCGYSIVPLPYSLWNMTKLRNLHIRGIPMHRDASWSLPIENPENSGLLDLDTFSTLVVSVDQRVENMLEKIPNVRKQKILLSKATESTTSSSFNMSGLVSLESLKLRTKLATLDHVQLSFPLSLKKLVLEGLYLPWSHITVLEELPNLEVLKVVRQSFTGDRWVLTEGGFPKLRFLSLKCLDIIEWVDTGSDDHFPRLQKLQLSSLGKLKSMPSCLKQISDLEVIEVLDCDLSVEDLVREIEEEQKSYGNECMRISVRSTNYNGMVEEGGWIKFLEHFSTVVEDLKTEMLRSGLINEAT